MLSIEVKNDANTNSAAVSIDMKGSGSDLVTEIVIGSIAAIKKVSELSGGSLSYQDAANLLCSLIADYKDFKEA